MFPRLFSPHVLHVLGKQGVCLKQLMEQIMAIKTTVLYLREMWRFIFRECTVLYIVSLERKHFLFGKYEMSGMIFQPAGGVLGWLLHIYLGCPVLKKNAYTAQ